MYIQDEQDIRFKDWETVAEHLQVTELTCELLNNIIRVTPKVSLLDALSKGQLASKGWLLNTVFRLEASEELPPPEIFTLCNVAVVGGWFGILPGFILGAYDVNEVISFDCDPACEPIANAINERHTNQGRFTARTENMYFVNYKLFHTIINTSFEHLRSPSVWINTLKRFPDRYVIVQSNNYTEIHDHINCCDSHDELVEQLKFDEVYYKGTLGLPDYERYMVIGKYK